VIDYVGHIASLAKEVEAEDPIDWGMLAISEDDAYRLMASNVVETMAAKYGQPEFKDVMLATIVKLVVENFVLNLKLKER
jgi:hypothetical protein